MRRVRTDVSHRIRRPASIFAAWWFRGLLAAGSVAVVLLLVGPWLVGWYGTELPHSLAPLLPWGGGRDLSYERPVPPGSRPGPGGPTPSDPGESTGRATDGVRPAPRAGEASASVGAAPGTAPAAAPAPVAPNSAVTGSPARPPASTVPRPAAPRAPSLTVPAPVYWVQVGAFLDHRNADRLVERLRSEGHPATSTVFEQSRVAYRVLLAGQDGATGPSPELVERVQGLGLAIESTPDGPAVGGLVSLRRAVETSHALRQHGIRVRLKQEVDSSIFRVVRVGSFATSAEAEAALASLAARGLQGIVVQGNDR